MFRAEKGITLVALVITIIVLLILAGVAISMLATDGGLIDRAVNSAEKYNEGAQNEKNEVDNLLEYYNNAYDNLTANNQA